MEPFGRHRPSIFARAGPGVSERSPAHKFDMRLTLEANLPDAIRL